MNSSIKEICRDIIKTKQVGFPSKFLSKKNKVNFKKTFDKLLENLLKEEYENTCCNEGFVIPKSLKIIERNNIRFPLESTKLTYVVDCKFQVTVCCPFKDAVINCKVISKNKIGLLCKINPNNSGILEEISPLVILIPNDLSNGDEDSLERIKNINIDDEVFIRVLGKKFEQFDKTITVIGQLITQNTIFKSVKINQ
jgi:DNA-directed RNA polymerase subunit E'/Rpb7